MPSTLRVASVPYLVGRPVELLMKPFGPFELKGLLERMAFNTAYESTF